MGMGMGTRIYPLPGEDEDEKKVWYPVRFGCEDGDKFFF